MKKYLKINIIEFILIAILIYCWVMGVIHVIGIAVLYILGATREKWVMLNNIEKLKNLNKQEPVTMCGTKTKKPATIPITFYYQDKIIGKGWVIEASNHSDRLKVAMDLNCTHFNKYLMGPAYDRGAIKVSDDYYEKDPLSCYVFAGQAWKIIN